MTLPASSETETFPAPEMASEPAEHRRHRRTLLGVKARFMLPDGQEGEGRIVNVSAGGARIEARTVTAVGDTIVLYGEKLGRLTGEVVRTDRFGFALRFTHKAPRAKRLADTLTWLVNMPASGADKRRARRYPQDKPARMVLPCGRVIGCRILDISTTGASVGTEERPPKGSRVVIGRMVAEVVRHHEEGVGVIFAAKAGTSRS
ncbi:PilZ domain-containing protein [Parvularcula dongshanensis]|uniref:PilZ domain-containing protein n=1 Tax=Parvularcula dongshanensis TaxID=1173995 RepID=A0A840I429_9PROT|nr:PilZ domain-containing protein [Parvularcula dongshanensis]MBB4659031.1 hypothetical protein [Parvularcula dongshanensis]